MSTELTIITIQNPLQVFSTPNGLDSIIDKIEAEAKSIDRDISTEAGRDNIRSLAFKLAKSKTFLDKMGKELTEEQRAQITAVNAERKRAWERMEALQEEIRAPLTALENKDKIRTAVHEANIIFIAVDLVNFNPDASLQEIEEKMNILASKFQGLDMEEFAHRYEQAIDQTDKFLKASHARRTKEIADAAELARFRAAEEQRMQQERDAKIAKDARLLAEQKAVQAAEVERQRVETERMAEAARAQKTIDDAAAALAAAEKKAADDAAAAAKALKDAQEKAERDKAAALKKQAGDAAAAKRAEEDATRKREADQNHKANINREARAAIKKVLDSYSGNDPDGPAQNVIVAIAKGEIPHVKIFY